MGRGWGRITGVAVATLLVTVSLAPSALADADKHVQLSGKLHGHYASGGETRISVDHQGNATTATVVSADLTWVLTHTLLLPSSGEGVFFELEGSWDEGFHGETIGSSFCDWTIDIDPYEDGQDIRIYLRSIWVAPNDFCNLSFWGDFTDTNLEDEHVPEDVPS